MVMGRADLLCSCSRCTSSSASTGDMYRVATGKVRIHITSTSYGSTS